MAINRKVWLTWFVYLLPILGGCSGIYYQQQLPQPVNMTNKKPAASCPGNLQPASTGKPGVVKEKTTTTPAADQSATSQRKIVIFFDGTANDVESDTNVKRLHSLISLQNKPEVATLYLEGVGVGNDWIGAGTGVGFKSRVALAYNFLRTHYRSGDKIYLFGFSRGAYEARVLAAMLYYIGLPDMPEQVGGEMSFDKRESEARLLVDELKQGFHLRHYPCTIAKLRALNKPRTYRPREVEVLGLWDTVGALGGGISGWPERVLHKTEIKAIYVDVDEPNDRYGDQLHNVHYVFHAMSLDDDREWIFTPLLMTRQHLLSNKHLPNHDERQAKLVDDSCADSSVDFSKSSIDISVPQITEVWFAGAHSDVGGGYSDSDLSGVSLNWMISMLDDTAKAGLLPTGTSVREDPYGTSHNPEAGKFSPLYHRINRNIAAYALGNTATCGLSGELAHCNAAGMHEPMPQFAGKLLVHESVFKRRMAMPPKDHENNYLDLTKEGTVCVKAADQLSNPQILVQERLLDKDKGKECPAGTLKVLVEKWSATVECDNKGTQGCPQ